MNPAERPTRAPSGRPLVALAGVLGCWAAARVAVWKLPEAPLPFDRLPARLVELAAMPVATAPASGRSRVPVSGLARSGMAGSLRASGGPWFHAEARAARSASVEVPRQIWASERPAFRPSATLMRGADTGSLRQPDAAEPVRQPRPSPAASRWGADVWLALREGGERLGEGGAFAPAYGASQAGAVLRFDIAPGSPHRPAAFARAVQALGGAKETDLAAGVSARLLPGLPVTAHVEARASRRADGVEIRPAAFVTAGIDDASLPLGLRARGYAQGGYVGGRDATAFADGSLVAERQLLAASGMSLDVGGGLWAGAQRGAGRVDIGPSASLRAKLGDRSARLTIDYRLRVAGNAAPASGFALTLAAGF